MNPVAVVDGATPDKINAAAAANLKNVVRWSTPVAANSAGLGAAVVVPHDLGVIPNAIRVVPLVDSRWWVDQDDRSTWNTATVTLHTSHAGTFLVRAGIQ